MPLRSRSSLVLLLVALAATPSLGMAAASSRTKGGAEDKHLTQRIAEAQRWTQSGHDAHAVDAWRRVLDAAPNHPDALVQLGVLLAKNGEMPEAELTLAQAQRVKPSPAGLKSLTAALTAAKARGGAPLAPPMRPAASAAAEASAPSGEAATTPVRTASSAGFPPPPPLPPDPWAAAPNAPIPPQGASTVAPAVPPPPAGPGTTSIPVRAASSTATSAPPAVAIAPPAVAVGPASAPSRAAASSSAAPAPKLTRKERIRLERERKAALRAAARAAKLEKQQAQAVAKPGASAPARANASAAQPAAPASAPKTLVLPAPTPMPTAPWASNPVPSIPAIGPAPPTAVSAGSAAFVPNAPSLPPSAPPFVPPKGDPAALLAELRTPSAMIERWTDTRLKLEALADMHPQNPQVLTALAGHLALREGTRREAIRQYESLTARSLGTSDTREAWRQALMSLSPRPGDDALYVSYLTRYPDDGRVAEHLRVLHGAGTPAGADPSRAARP